MKKYSHKYGYGMINATGAVLIAKNWVNYQTPQSAIAITHQTSLHLPDGGATVTPVNDTISIIQSPQNNIIVEQVEIYVPKK